MARSRDELLTALGEQLQAIRTSSAAFDAGQTWEAKRLATAVHVILYDGGSRTVSLLTQLGIKNKLPFVSTAFPPNSNNLLAEMPLVVVKQMASRAEYVPLCSIGGGPMAPRHVSFDDWWQEPVFTSREKDALSRKSLVLTLRDQEGGAHFDDEVRNAIYRAVAQENAAGWLYGPSDAPGRPIDPGPHFATMRQIVWEVEQTLAALPGGRQ